MDENTLRQLCEKLEDLKRSANYSSILAEFDQRFDRIVTEVLPQCLDRTLTRVEKTAVDLVSSLELIIIQHLIELHNEEKPLPTNEFRIRGRFFQQRKIDALRNLVEGAQEENLDDDILPVFESNDRRASVVLSMVLARIASTAEGSERRLGRLCQTSEDERCA